jgi:flagellar hook-basal body complex protein FliE
MSKETTMAIAGIRPIERPEMIQDLIQPKGGAGAAGASSFMGELGKAIDGVDKLQVAADQEAQSVANGGGNVHELAIALEKADVSMRLALKVRNKVVEAYTEIMRMSV